MTDEFELQCQLEPCMIPRMQLLDIDYFPAELEQTYEVKRNERKNRKSRGRPPKRARRDKEVSASYQAKDINPGSILNIVAGLIDSGI